MSFGEWTDNTGDLQFYIIFNSISVISGQAIVLKLKANYHSNKSLLCCLKLTPSDYLSQPPGYIRHKS